MGCSPPLPQGLALCTADINQFVRVKMDKTSSKLRGYGGGDQWCWVVLRLQMAFQTERIWDCVNGALRRAWARRTSLGTLVRLALGALEDRGPQRTVPEGIVMRTNTGGRRLGSPPSSSPESAIPPSGTGTMTWDPNGGIGRAGNDWAPWVALVDGLVGRTVK